MGDDVKINLKDIPSQTLIDELNSRDLFEEIKDNKTKEWLKDKTIIDITKFQFFSLDNGNLYSLEYINSLSYKEFRKNYLRELERSEEN